jgi:hypothetical protein
LGAVVWGSFFFSFPILFFIINASILNLTTEHKNSSLEGNESAVRAAERNKKGSATENPVFTLLLRSIHLEIYFGGMRSGVGREILPVLSSMVT